MCGINGLIFLDGKFRSKEMMQKIRFVFDELLIETEARGHHATGLVSYKRNGSYEHHKAALSATDMVMTDSDYRNVINGFDGKDTSAVISHTRWYTKGKPTNNNNNHPFDVGNILGLHNGTVKNDDELFKKYEFNRIGEVDSEIIFQLINHYNQEDISYEGLKKALEDTKLTGKFALSFMHKANPNLVHFVKQERPMELALWKEAGIIIFNSEGKYIKDAFKVLHRVSKSFGFKKAEETVEYLKVEDDTYFTIDATATSLKKAISKAQPMVLNNSDKKTYSRTGSSYTGTRGATGDLAKQYQSVTAKDAKGITLYGEIDKVTGEVLIYSGAEQKDDDVFTIDVENCVECSNELSEHEVEAAHNDDNPSGEKICADCYDKVLESFKSEADKKEKNPVL